ncbi:putative lipid II flippase FtsW [Leadbettera azotonutricia]|uniref:Probable peptidoglycan glycosyltransferase FtsW n=1 Tax=Leadbettera azotonutricia (strain ATCC BAA-888 / DSM 13862 / ZAS-9) TaxID=545695 RepID=F5Y8X9_LEAAZ|nr:putative lipid II flippase FtsW [Leadbettera azotonutricia]AEF80764.1 cell division protein FtsW [Leadbettera azotonutricia ZAS-9]
MSQFDTETRHLKQPADHILIASILLLTGLGLVTLHSSSYGFAERFKGDGLYFFSRQIVLAAAGLVLFFIASNMKLDLLRKMIGFLVLGTILLCILTFIPGVGVSKNGASRWIHFGSFTFQPSELVKLVLPLYLAHLFDKKGDDIDRFSKGILPPVMMTTLFVFLIYLQNNFSTAMFIVLNVLIIFYFAGVRFRYFFSAIVILAPISFLLIATKEHRFRRVMSFFFPEMDPLGAGYQVRSSVRSVSSGGFWGKGLGLGTRKIASVPEIHSDFIFSAYAEESGYLGILLFALLFAVFAFRGYSSAMGNEKTFPRLLGLGLVTMVITQTLLNITVVAGSLPATGVPLPFFSAGGSSLATTLIMAGLIVNISKTRNVPSFAGNTARTEV